MIEIINSGNYASEKATLDAFEINTSDHIKLILDNPHTLIFNSQSFILNYRDRYYQSLLKTQHPLLSAIGQQSGSLLDACGGFGKDSFILAHQGLQVTTCEENPIIAILLQQAVQNYCQKYPLSWRARQGPSQQAMKPSSFDIVYLDPMFQVNRTAKPKLSMQIIQSLSSSKPFFDWKLAWETAVSRLVIKQHQKSPIIDALPKPNMQIKGKQNIRYDIYIK